MNRCLAMSKAFILMKLKRVGYNQTVLTMPNKTEVLFSYETPVAAQLPSGDYVRTEQKFSRTTTRHISKWLEGVNALEVSQEVINNIAEDLPTNITSTEHN